MNYQGGKWYKLAYDLLLISDSLLCHSPSLKYYEWEYWRLETRNNSFQAKLNEVDRLFRNSKIYINYKHLFGKDWVQEEKGATENEMVGCHRRLKNMSLSKLWEMVKDREAWHAAVCRVRHNWVTEQQAIPPRLMSFSSKITSFSLAKYINSIPIDPKVNSFQHPLRNLRSKVLLQYHIN